MNLDQLLVKIDRLRGIWLTPLGRARRIKVVEVDTKGHRVVLQVEGEQRKRSRPFSEFESLLHALKRDSAIHVDSVLAGSGSSRNQPETILANLPGIEYLKIDGRKHLARVSDHGRAYGTIKAMDAVQAQALAASLLVQDKTPPVAVLVVDAAHVALAATLAAKRRVSQTALSADAVVIGKKADGLFVASSAIGLPDGAYPMFDTPAHKDGGKVIELGAERYAAVDILGHTCLFRLQAG